MSKRVKGLKEFNRFMENHQRQMPKVIEAAMIVGGMEIEREAKQRCPRPGHSTAATAYARMLPTGNLVNSIHTVPKHERGEIQAIIGTNVEYGKYLEFGTVKMTPRAFLRPALDTRYQQAVNMVVKQLRRYFGE